MKAKIILPLKSTLPEGPLSIRDLPDIPPEITQTEIVAFATASHVFRVARADWEAKRAALCLKLLQFCVCEEGSYFATLDEHGQLVVEDRTSLEPVTRRPILDRECVPSGGAA
jgi:hypothetical protein